ncbi:hypothetical protein S245_055092 [Arachis hypogaea]
MGHKCKSTYFLLVSGEEMEELLRGGPSGELGGGLPNPIATPTDKRVIEIIEISFNAMVGVYHPKTIRIAATCEGQPIMVLVDGGSTHNFMKASTAMMLGLPITLVSQLNVYVSNGECIGCISKCNAVPLQM